MLEIARGGRADYPRRHTGESRPSVWTTRHTPATDRAVADHPLLLGTTRHAPPPPTGQWPIIHFYCGPHATPPPPAGRWRVIPTGQRSAVRERQDRGDAGRTAVG